MLAAGCGGDGPASPARPSDPTGQPAPPQGAILQIHTRAAMLRVGEREAITVNVSQGGPDVTGVAQLESSNQAVLVIEEDRRMLAVGAGTAEIRARYQNLSQSIPQVVVEIGPTPNAMPSIEGPAVLISEFRTSGPAGPADEFIELRNVSSRPVDLANWSIAFVTATRHRESMGLIPRPAVLGPGCHYLLAGHSGPNAYSSGSLSTGDFRWSSVFFLDDVSFALIDDAGRIADQVGLNADPIYVEGQPLAPLAGRSRERTSDTNRNRADFQPSAQDSPRNRQSSCS